MRKRHRQEQFTGYYPKKQRLCIANIDYASLSADIDEVFLRETYEIRRHMHRTFRFREKTLSAGIAFGGRITL